VTSDELHVKLSLLTIGALLLAAVTLLGGAIQGKMARRWGRPREFAALAARLQELPTEIGAWRARESRSLTPTAEAVLECAGYVSRQYQNRKTGEIVNVAVLLGPAGPISVHTPDICYSAQDYSVLEPPKRTQFDFADGSHDELWATSLRPTSLTDFSLRVYYGWSTGGRWQAQRDARIAFAGQPHLYKLQVAGSLPSTADSAEPDACATFLREFLPAARPFLAEFSEE
jgi:hypothetical protein